MSKEAKRTVREMVMLYGVTVQDYPFYATGRKWTIACTENALVALEADWESPKVKLYISGMGQASIDATRSWAKTKASIIHDLECLRESRFSSQQTELGIDKSAYVDTLIEQVEAY